MDLEDQNWAHAISSVHNEITKADSKAGAILTLDGLLVAALGLMGRATNGPVLAIEAIGAVTLTASVLLALTVIRPRLGAPGGGHDGASFITWKTAKLDQIEACMREDRRALRVQTASRIVDRKMRYQRWAGDCAFLATCAIAAGAILSH
ncbi:Pycsar system effector family protein [Streptomyces noursei]